MVTAIAHPNIALVKYWGKRDIRLNLPSTGSLSMTVDTFRTRTTVNWGAGADELWLDGELADARPARRVFEHLDRIDPWRPRVVVTSESNFPASAGLASSSSAFAALTLAACAAAGQTRSPQELSVLARQGSGSACRSLWGGFVEWHRGRLDDGSDSHGAPLAPEDHWDVALVVAIFDSNEKKVGSREAMIRTMETSPMYGAWVASAGRDLDGARQAVLDRDLEALGVVMERSATKMHATMMTADPAIRYWLSGSVWAMDAVEGLRRQGIGAWWTMDAGPNVKVLCEREDAEYVAQRLSGLAQRVQILGVGGAPRLVEG
jgi:diphosphomevalonate decarboxylase